MKSHVSDEVRKKARHLNFISGRKGEGETGKKTEKEKEREKERETGKKTEKETERVTQE